MRVALTPWLVGLALLVGCRGARPAEPRSDPIRAPSATEPEVAEARAPVAPDRCAIDEVERADIVFELPAASTPTGAVARTCARIGSSARRLFRAPMPAAWRERDAEIREDNAGIEDEYERTETLEARRGSFRAAFGRCQGVGAGAWVLEPTRASHEPSLDGRYVVTARLAYVDAAGAILRAEEEEWFLAPLRAHDEHLARTPSLRPVFDFDGDGRWEAELEAATTWGAMGGFTRERTLFTATQTEVRPAPLPEDARIDLWVDADRDGRPDVLSAEPFRTAECQEIDSGWGAPYLLVHAGPGLAFSNDDETARAWGRRVCPCRPTRLLAEPRHDHDGPLYSQRTLLRIACARLWGDDVASIEERLGAEMRELGEADGVGDVCAYSEEQLVGFAEPEPPFVLGASSPPAR
ncbi:MAG: hypothetical protein R3B82_10690 [Sandaracinaceae bacterium]